MTRWVALVILALTLTAAPVHAQNSAFTVTVQSADVYKGPTTGSPVIGQASRGTVLTVARNLGSWAEVLWPGAPGGVGYVHMTRGRLNTSAANEPAAATSARTASSASPAMAAMTPATSSPQAPMPQNRVPQGGTRISHTVGVGGLVGSMSSFGATTRWWHDRHVGVQVGFTRDAMTSDVAAGRVTSMQVEPGVVYALFDRVPGYLWVRPYAGSAVSFRHQTWKDTSPALMPSVSDNGVGYRVFGGAEVTFASVTPLGLSAELGYRRLPTPFVGFEPDRWSVAVAGHWYIK